MKDKLTKGIVSPINVEIPDGRFLWKIDARIKLIVTLFLLIAVIFMDNLAILPILAAIILIIPLLILKISLREYLRRFIILPFSIALILFIVVAFTYGGIEEVYSVFGLKIYRESISFGLLLFTRVIISVSVLQLFILTTSINDNIEALRWFRVPKEVVDIGLLMIRYISLLFDEFKTMYNAQVSRGGFLKRIGYKKRIKNLSSIAGLLFIKSENKGERIYSAMVSRGYNLNFYNKNSKKYNRSISLKEFLLCILMILFITLFVIADKI